MGERLEQLQAVYQLAAAVNRAERLAEVLDEALETLIRAGKATRAAIRLVDPDGALRFKAWRHLSEECRRAVEAAAPRADEGSLAPTVIPDLLEEPSPAPHLRALLAEGVRAFGSVPLWAGARLMGELTFGYDAPRPFEHDEVRLAEVVSRHVALAVARKQAEEKLALYREIFDHSSDGIAVIDTDGRYLEQNLAHELMLGYSAEEIAGRTPAIHLGEETFADMARELGRSGILRMEVRSRRNTGELRDLDLSAFTVRDEAGQARCFVGIKRDISGRKRTETSLRLLADAGTLLDAALDYDASLATVAGLAVPGLADGALADVVLPPGPTRRLAVAHSGPASPALEALRDHCVEAPAFASTMPRQDEEGCLGAEALRLVRATYAPDPQGQALLDQVGVRDAMCVPLLARGRQVGVLTLLASTADRSYDEADLALARELGRRAGLALDNARLYRDAHESDRRKDEFLAMLAHELRNPLAPILTSLQLMELKEGDAETLRRCREILGRQVRQLAHLIDDLLDVSRITRGRIALRRQRVELAEAVRRAVDTARPLIEEKRHQLTVAVAAGLWLDADPVRLEQIVLNLLTNGAKYTEPGGRIRVSAEALADGRLAIRVSDNGIGIAPEMLAQVFDPFVQGDRALDRAQGGLGIGLTLVRGLAHLHGGTVSASSPGPGRGSEFVVTLPAARPEQADAPLATPTRAAHAPAPPRRVLVVDDNVDAAHGIAAALETWGHTVETAHDGSSAVSKALRFRPDLILLDIGLPGIDGYEVARRMKREPALAAASLVALTGYGQENDRQRARQAGFDDHLVKPVDLTTIEGLLGASPTRRGPP